MRSTLPSLNSSPSSSANASFRRSSLLSDLKPPPQDFTTVRKANGELWPTVLARDPHAIYATKARHEAPQTYGTSRVDCLEGDETLDAIRRSSLDAGSRTEVVHLFVAPALDDLLLREHTCVRAVGEH